MSSRTLTAILAATFALTGCESNPPPAAPPPPPPRKANVDVQAPGVDVKVGEGGVDVKAPGADVQVEKR
jgi:hypothetical protein